ncbi:unnamed protein product, partial [Timema podura]|nr:unnamed protein product [Timema podura]
IQKRRDGQKCFFKQESFKTIMLKWMHSIQVKIIHSLLQTLREDCTSTLVTEYRSWAGPALTGLIREATPSVTCLSSPVVFEATKDGILHAHFVLSTVMPLGNNPQLERQGIGGELTITKNMEGEIPPAVQSSWIVTYDTTAGISDIREEMINNEEWIAEATEGNLNKK